MPVGMANFKVEHSKKKISRKTEKVPVIFCR